MVAVSPDIRLAARAARKRPPIFSASGRWLRWFVGRLPGEYTIGKLDAFDRFRQQTAPSRLFQVFLVTTIPCLVVNVLLESIPLNDPRTGFRGSLHFQIRNFVAATIMATAPVLVKLSCVPQLGRTWKFAVGFGAATATAGIVVNAIIAVAADVFPVPFTQFAPAVPMAMVGILLNRLFLYKPELKIRLEKIDQWSAVDMMPILVYPVVTAIFMALQPNQQLWLSLLLPVVKLLIRYFIWSVVKDDVDLVGATTCTVGHLYHLLFTAMCLQNAKSLETLAALVFVNLLQMIINCRRILRDANRIRILSPLLCDVGDIIASTLQLAKKDHVSEALHCKIPSRLISKFTAYQSHSELPQMEPKCTTVSPQKSIDSIEQNQRRGSRHRSLTGARKETGPSLTQAREYLNHQGLNSASTDASPTSQCVIPISKQHSARRLSAYELRTASSTQDEAVVRSVTATLFQTEIILLRSFITVFVTSFYGIYLTLVFHLPNRKYFATMALTTTYSAMDSTISHLVLLCAIEVFFFAVYLLLMRQHLKISGIHQLAFVLWSQWIPIQAKFVALSLMILGFPLQHYGNGVIYRFHPESIHSE